MRIIGTRSLGLAIAISALSASPVAAQSLEELDALSDASAQEESGVQLARDQAGRGELLEALATLERVLVEHPKSANARLLQAFYLCRLDDRPGGSVALSKLKSKNYSDDALATVRTTCENPPVAESMEEGS